MRRPSTPRSAADDPGDVTHPPRLLDRVRQAIRMRHYSRRTENTYVHWIRRFIIRQQVSASTQNQALSALLFLYRHVLHLDIGPLDPVGAAESIPPARVGDSARGVLGRAGGWHHEGRRSARDAPLVRDASASKRGRTSIRCRNCLATRTWQRRYVSSRAESRQPGRFESAGPVVRGELGQRGAVGREPLQPTSLALRMCPFAKLLTDWQLSKTAAYQPTGLAANVRSQRATRSERPAAAHGPKTRTRRP
jgi:hypothetical protein